MSDTKDFRSLPVSNFLTYFDQHEYLLNEWRFALDGLSEYSRELFSDMLLAYLNARKFSCPEDVVSAVLLFAYVCHRFGNFGLKAEFDPIQNGLAVQLLTELFKYSAMESEEVSSDG